MSTINAQAISTAIDERVSGVLTGGRSPLAPKAFDTDIYGGAADFTKLARAVVRPTCEISLGMPTRQEDSPNISGDTWLYDLAVTVTVVHKLDNPGAKAARYDLVKNQAVVDCDRITRALCDSGALSLTRASVATGIVSGMLFPTSARVLRDDSKTGVHETALSYSCIVKVTVP